LSREEEIVKHAAQLPPYAKSIAVRIVLNCLKHSCKAPAFREVNCFEYELWASSLSAVYEENFGTRFSEIDKYVEYTTFCLKYGFLIEELIELSFLHLTSHIEGTMRQAALPNDQEKRRVLLDNLTEESRSKIHQLILAA
ncbi:MAG: hypothetical protein KDD55_13790, partial [Bdellovibrionales bacterium]|nr:hypothetical protein [Bdellovibrionales bacterium]